MLVQTMLFLREYNKQVGFNGFNNTNIHFHTFMFAYICVLNKIDARITSNPR